MIASWVNEAEQLDTADSPSDRGSGAEFPPGLAAGKIDTQSLHLINCTVKQEQAGIRLSTKDEDVGYALQRCEKPLRIAVFRFAVRRAPGTRRHGNAFFVCGASDRGEDWIECRLYYGGRSSLMITGGQARHVEKKVSFPQRDMFVVTVRVDCKNRTVHFEAAGHQVASQINGSMDGITHYGQGGANADNVFTAIRVE